MLDRFKDVVQKGPGVCSKGEISNRRLSPRRVKGERTFGQKVGNLLLAEVPNSLLIAVMLQQRDNVLGKDVGVGVGAADDKSVGGVESGSCRGPLRVLDSLDDPRLERRRVFFWEQHHGATRACSLREPRWL